jgi:hypothetical protein
MSTLANDRLYVDRRLFDLCSDVNARGGDKKRIRFTQAALCVESFEKDVGGRYGDLAERHAFAEFLDEVAEEDLEGSVLSWSAVAVVEMTGGCYRLGV